MNHGLTDLSLENSMSYDKVFLGMKNGKKNYLCRVMRSFLGFYTRSSESATYIYLQRLGVPAYRYACP